ncbi:CTD nuclear envelope phosphatase 1-like [Xenia sp. Carnegie-2017]|uniref:CTD nuclear envelope phosphatase 1-like n=1 Tax=Xenia sp. Carnegie-2017 TaxID=2897299 RepID=UPI001F04946E|nr:CTD nuclear envelope phosphatase 1-like [Xenia sp. Carnegie-2017]
MELKMALKILKEFLPLHKCRRITTIFVKLWSLIVYILKRNMRAVIEHQTIRYSTFELSPLSQQRLRVVRRKTFVLDLDETLIHSQRDGTGRKSLCPNMPADFVLRVTVEHQTVRFLVHKRPHLDFFLKLVCQWFDLVVFTASLERYGTAVTDKIDGNRKFFSQRYFRHHCTLHFGTYIKDLSIISEDLSSIFILDNSPGAYMNNKDNAIPIKSWFADPSDKALLNILPMLDALRFTADVRSILSRNVHNHSTW